MSDAASPFVISLVLAVSVQAAAPPKAAGPSVRHSVGIGCVSIPRDWQVSVDQHPGWASGQIRGTTGSRIMAFTIGTGSPAASRERREQFQWFRTEKLGDSILNYALEKKGDGRGVLQASVIRGSLNANFVTPERDLQSLSDLLLVARSYSREKCLQ
jgi:hypothetical protein